MIGWLLLVLALCWVSYMAGRTSEWSKVLTYLNGQGVDDWIVTGITIDEHRDPPSEWQRRSAAKGELQP